MTIPDSVFDAGLDKIATGNKVTFCSAEPANYAGIAAVALVSNVITAGDGNGDWVIANGDTSGRKLTLGEQANMTPSGNGTVLFLAIDDGAELLATSPVTSQAVLTTETWNSPAVKVLELRDPSYA